MTLRDVIADHIFCSKIVRTRGFSRPAVNTSGPFNHEASGSVLLSRVESGRFRKNVLKTFRDGAICSQQAMERNGRRILIALQDAGVEPRLATESGIEAGRADTQRFGDVAYAHRIISTCME